MKKVVRVFLLMITLVMWSSIVTEAAYFQYYGCADKKMFLDLDGDKKKEEIIIKESGESADIYINSTYTLHISDWGFYILDLFEDDKYMEIVVRRNKPKMVMDIYRYNGEKLALYAEIPGMNWSSNVKGKNVLNCLSDSLVGTNGKGILKTNLSVIIKNRNNPLPIKAEYKIKKGKAQMVEKEYALSPVLDVRATSDWTIYKNASVKSNKKLFSIKKGTLCEVYKIKITSKYTFMKLGVLGGNTVTRKVGWVMLPTSQMRFCG